MSRTCVVLAVGVIALVRAVLAQSGPTEAVEPNEPLKPLTIVVVDAEAGAPIPAFDYRYSVSAASGYEAGDRAWRAVKSEAGTVTLDLPVSCLLSFGARAAGYRLDTCYLSAYPIKAADTKRRIEHALERGTTVTGHVMDAATSQPIGGVRVSPLQYCNPCVFPDRERSVYSEPDGRFEIAGVNAADGFGITFEHADYLVAWWFADDPQAQTTWAGDEITVRLEAGLTVSGVVRSSDGQSIEGATVDAVGAEETQTAADGTFQLRGMCCYGDSGTLRLRVEKAGYMKYSETSQGLPAGCIEITLEPLLKLQGQVTDSSGQSVKQFTVIAGSGADQHPFACVEADITDDEGRFSVAIDTGEDWQTGTQVRGQDTTPTGWVAVRSAGYAVWEGPVRLNRDGGTIAVALQPGVAVSARLSGVSADFTGGEAVLAPERPPGVFGMAGTASEKVGTRRTAVAADGTLRFEHVRPDNYRLQISGRGITPHTLVLAVPGEDLEIAPIKV